MKKPIKSILLNNHTLTDKQVWALAERLNKDDRTFKTALYSSKGRELIKQLRLELGIQAQTITKPLEQMFPSLESEFKFYEDKYIDTAEEIHLATLSLLKTVKLSDRFYDSVKATLIYNKPTKPRPPLQFIFKKTKKELFMKLYPDSVFRDVKLNWHRAFKYQKNMPETKAKAKYKFLKRETGERYLLVQIFKNTTLSNLDKDFRDTQKKRFADMGIQKRHQGSWRYRKALEVELTSESEESDWDIAEKVFNNEHERFRVKRIKHQLKKKRNL